MKKLLILSMILFNSITWAQVGIGTVTPDTSAALDISSNNQGFLMPRMTQVQRIAISSPATGLLVYQTDLVEGLYYFDGIIWQFLNCSGSSTGLSVGDYYMGGIVFYVESTGLHGLVVGLDDLGNTDWGFMGTSKWTRISGIYGGVYNTLALASYGQQMSKNCKTYTSNNYSTWYLPSIEELRKLNNNFATVNSAIISNGGTAVGNSIYWSSTENGATTTHCFNFNNNTSTTADKHNSYRYRAIKSF